ncbi:MAG: 30S ribosomal protein S8 [Chloroflexota bacterium]|nr:MAG: 30S ribosomal protein S8 [Chloroflexota bacterium]
MKTTDPIADMLTRVRNATRAYHPAVDMPYSNMKIAIAKIMEQEGYIAGHDVKQDGNRKMLRLQLKYDSQRRPVFTGLRRVSRPGLRVYAGMHDIPRVLGGAGTVVVSTNRGIMTGHEARRRHLGGELLAEIW